EDARGAIWIATAGGVSRYYQEHLATIQGEGTWLHGVVLGIEEVAHGFLWLTTNVGVVRAHRLDMERALFKRSLTRDQLRIYSTADGMLSDRCSGGSQPALWKTQDERLWVPTQNGVAIISPARTTLNTLPPPVRIERLFVNHEEVPLQEPLRFHAK